MRGVPLLISLWRVRQCLRLRMFDLRCACLLLRLRLLLQMLRECRQSRQDYLCILVVERLQSDAEALEYGGMNRRLCEQR